MGSSGKSETARQEQQSVAPQDVATDSLPKCATVHMILDPCYLWMGYSLYARFDSIPVALEKVDCNGWHPSVQIPNNAEVYKYLKSFINLPVEFRKLPLLRTIVEYKLASGYNITDKKTGKTKSFPGCSLWLFPMPYMIVDDDWLSYMTPEIRKDIAKRVRTYKALSEQLLAMRNAQAVR